MHRVLSLCSCRELVILSSSVSCGPARVVPKAVLPSELIGETPGEVKAVSGMHQRKAEMARSSDAFVALPGGYGTLEELLEAITWAQLGIHDKPVSPNSFLPTKLADSIVYTLKMNLGCRWGC